MKKIIKKSIIVFLISATVVISVLALVGCEYFGKRDYEDGNFIYVKRWKGMEVIGVYICELTEAGKQEKILVIPKENREVKVLGLADGRKLYSKARLQSDNLEKVFFLDAIYVDGGFVNCPRLSKIITQYSDPSVYFFSSSYIEEVYIALPYYSPEYDCIPANVAFMLNFTNAPNNGYYWVDDIENGEKIEYIPENPTREGYTFGGWYKEAECVNEWSFDADTVVKVEVTEETTQENFVETRLYAKWK